MSFQNLGLSDAVVHGVQSLGYVDPTPIQERCIPLILEKKDLIGSAQTGTGKTAAFALPILTLLGERKGPRCLVLEPTRELALQVENAFQYYGRFSEADIRVFYGAVGYDRHKRLHQSVLAIIFTPPCPLLHPPHQPLTHLTSY